MTELVAPAPQSPAEATERGDAATAIQRREADDQSAADRASEAARPTTTGGLPQPLRTGIETLSGFDMSDVRVHHDSPQPARMNALAFAQGADIHLGPGQVEHLPHEAWHVVQQKQGRVAPGPQHKGGINADPALEQEADEMGARALATPGGGGGVAALAQRAASTAAPVQRKMRRSEGLIGDYGDAHRELDLNPDKNVESFTRWDDAPIHDEFRVVFNKLENWQIYVKTRNADLVPELAALKSPQETTMKQRSSYVSRVKVATTQYKKSIRDLGDADATAIRAEFDATVTDLTADMKALDAVVRTWFEDKTKDQSAEPDKPALTGEALDKEVTTEGNRLWRESWKDAIYEVNRILAAHWPALRQDLQKWLLRKRAEGLHLSGDIGELTYIGSLAKGYKGPPKQHVRFDPEKFDVDASLDAPPIAQFATEHKKLQPDKGKIFGKELYGDIPELEARSQAIDAALDQAKIVEHDDDEPFEIAIPARDAEGQRNQYSGSAGLALLRDKLSKEHYEQLLKDPAVAPLLEERKDAPGVALREIEDAEYTKLRARLLEVLNELPAQEGAEGGAQAEGTEEGATQGAEGTKEAAKKEPPALSEVLRQNMVKDFGDEHRDEAVEPDKGVESFTRWDDAPIHEEFRVAFNKLENWQIYVKTRNADLVPELAALKSPQETTMKQRSSYVSKVKVATTQYKKSIRDLSATDAGPIRTEFNSTVEALVADMKALDDVVRTWFEGKTKDQGAGQDKPGLGGEALDQEVTTEGDRLWRESWKDAIYEVNRILTTHWPALKQDLEKWLLRKRADGLHLSGEIGELTYIGSLAKGYKGPPKQHVRFDPEKFDVDASLDAPPIGQFATEHKKLQPDKGKIFGKELYGDIPELEARSHEIDTALDAAGLVDHDDDEPFEIAIPARDTEVQRNQYSGSAGLALLRDKLPPGIYAQLLKDPAVAPLLEPRQDAPGSALREIKDEDYAKLRTRLLSTLDQVPEEERPALSTALRDVLRQNMVKDFGDEYRKEDIEPNKDIHSYTRWDDAPIDPEFRGLYNKLENWVIYIKTKSPELNGELAAQVVTEGYSMAERAKFVSEAKKATTTYKAGIRDLSDANASKTARAAFEARISELVELMRELDAHVLAWFENRPESGEKKGEELADHVEAEGTDIWREAFKDSVYAVNRILTSKWPALKTALEIWVGERRAADVFLPGEIGELTYIGSLAKGYKGPPKQHVRFNPEKFDVDASLDAPPLARFATEHLQLKPDKGKIFGKDLYRDIPALETWSSEVDDELAAAKVVEKDENEPFEIAIPAKETPGQINQYSGSSALSTLRGLVAPSVYEKLLADDKIAPMLAAGGGKALGEISDDDYETLRAKILEIVRQHCDERTVRQVAHILRKS